MNERSKTGSLPLNYIIYLVQREGAVRILDRSKVDTFSSVLFGLFPPICTSHGGIYKSPSVPPSDLQDHKESGIW